MYNFKETHYPRGILLTATQIECTGYLGLYVSFNFIFKNILHYNRDCTLVINLSVYLKYKDGLTKKFHSL